MSPNPPSFERVDYSLRTNKNIERKLVFERLQELNAQFAFREYRYVGLGSMWFVDFILAHRILHVSDMWSFEGLDPERALFNRPYGCIEVRGGTSGKLLGEVTKEQWAKPVVAWLDYDGRFDSDVKKDVEQLLTQSSLGSVVIVSVNARHGSYRPKTADDPEARSIQTLRLLLGDSVPVNAIPGNRQDLGKLEFPAILSQSILNYMSAVVRTSGRSSNGKPDNFVPLFKLFHQDGVEMVTVGGLVLSAIQLANLAAQSKQAEADLVAGGIILNDEIDLIPITAREKLALDRLLPRTEDQFGEALAGSDLKLDVKVAAKYRRLYPHFPVFVEMFG